ncbi:RHTO0S16e04500g1_1 [Rhodotorula toruloides]|uniref:RHTO0S16e04500g1_1 n=1 Tax=Rhodotorula toruloides TaxID=5286 RepID=A0A061BE39_RHOTO|nr:RHTO0S16e04500g1_1 [Rhodotorula toruloides]
MLSQALSQPNQATPAPILRLPHELLSHIFEFCDAFPQRKATLRALCLVSRDFYKVAAPILYGRLVAKFGERLVYGSWFWQRRETTDSRLLRTLETSEKVAKLVKVLEVTMDLSERWVVPGPYADPDRQARLRIPTMPKLRTAEVTFVDRWNHSPDYSEGALLTLARAAPNLQILYLHSLNDRHDTTLKKIARLGNQFWEAWPKLEKVVVRKWRSEASPSHRKIAKDAKAWDVKIEPV